MLILNKLDCIRVHKVFYSISIYRFKAFWITRRYKINFLSLFIIFSNFPLNKIAYHMFCFLTSLLYMLFLIFVLAPSIWQGQIQDASEDTVKVYRLQTHMYINTHTHIYTHTYIYTHTHIHTHTHTHIHIHIHTHTHMVNSKFLPVSIRWYLCGFYRKFHCGASLWEVSDASSNWVFFLQP